MTVWSVLISGPSSPDFCWHDSAAYFVAWRIRSRFCLLRSRGSRSEPVPMAPPHVMFVLLPVPRGSNPTISWCSRSFGWLRRRAGKFRPGAPGPPGLVTTLAVASLVAFRRLTAMVRSIWAFAWYQLRGVL